MLLYLILLTVPIIVVVVKKEKEKVVCSWLYCQGLLRKINVTATNYLFGEIGQAKPAKGWGGGALLFYQQVLFLSVNIVFYKPIFDDKTKSSQK